MPKKGKNMYKFLLPLLIFFFAGCAPEIEKKQQEQLPLWLSKHDSFHAVGSSKVNFQGIYTQRLEAINKAKSDLSHRVESYISSVYQKESKTNGNSISTRIQNKVKSISNVFLKESYQVDAYIDAQRRLYVLVGISKAKVYNLFGDKTQLTSSKTHLPTLKTRPFDKKELMQSKCYSKNILETIDTKSDLYQNMPIWFFRPNQDGVVGSVGIAEKERGRSYTKQKSAAFILAKSAISKRQKTEISSEYELYKILHGTVSGENFETSSIVRSATKVQEVVQKDIWLDPKSCELYVWAIKKGQH